MVLCLWLAAANRSSIKTVSITKNYSFHNTESVFVARCLASRAEKEMNRRFWQKAF